MTRVLSLACLALCLLGLGASSAFAKPQIAVLGLEVIDQSGTPTPQDTQVAKELTEGLRHRALANTGTYQLAPGSDKELIDEKLLNNCDDEKPACMSAIGGQLTADALMYGRLQKEGKQYTVTVKLLDVGKKAVLKWTTEPIPVSESSGAALQTWAKKIYAKLTGESAGGTVVVKLNNAERGTILIDGEEKGNITAGTGQVTGLSEGKYKLAIESDGFHRWDKEITVTAGQTTSVSADLEKGSGPDTGPGPNPNPGGGGTTAPHEGGGGGGIWKGVFVGSLVVAAGGAGWWAYNYSKIKDVEDEECSHGANGCTATTTAYTGLQDPALKAADKRGHDAHVQTWVGGIVMGAGLGIAAVALYKGFIDSGNSSSESSTATSARGKRVRRERFVVTPIVSSDGRTAGIRLDF